MREFCWGISGVEEQTIVGADERSANPESLSVPADDTRRDHEDANSKHLP